MTRITHTVLVQWSSNAAQNSVTADDLVREVVGRIGGIDSATRGVSVSTEGLEGGFEWGMTLVFADEASLTRYLPDPEHQPLANHIRSGAERVIVFDVAGD